ncbi:hypothetical protein I5403_06030 [Citrobacter farmeri]|uniref:hypothetical protein n=1 Tax=Citrobacter farmeri TaxID=67824 RepID=UPI0019230B88|nr:hypothetical protein [Citrobacter farmeri]MBJ8744053.1 hypothetical protein [Citrobacter farmeri]MBJ8758132.1 hypothetical protein [Citrobacter farmeri]
MSEEMQRYNDEIKWRNDAINCLVRAINGLELNVEEEFLPEMIQDAIQTVRSQRHTVLILSARQILEAAEFAGLDVCVDPVNDELDEEYCIRTGMIAGSPLEGLEPYEGPLIESLLYPEEGAVPLSGDQPFKEYEPVIDEGFLRQAAQCNGWPGELASRLLVAAEIGQWIVGEDTGLSSLTMASVWLGAKSGQFSFPRDPSDFGRCWRLVEQIPAIRDAFPRIGAVYPPIAPYLEHWEELSQLYMEAIESGTGKAPELYQRMIALRESA